MRHLSEETAIMWNRLAIVSVLAIAAVTVLPGITRSAEPDANSGQVIFQTKLSLDPAVLGRYRALTYRKAEWYGSPFWTGPDWTRVGKDWHHPGQNTPSVRRFVAPRDGSITVTGRVFKLHQNGDGIRAIIRHNDNDVWQTEIDGKDGQGVEPQLKLDVKRGDSLRFIVHKRGVISCDTTGWDPVISYQDGDRHQASKAFASHKQGQDGWWYEMEADAASIENAPTVYAFTPELALFDQPVLPDKPVALTNDEALPVFVVARDDVSGVVVAMDPGRPWTFRAVRDGGDINVTLSADGSGESSVVWSQPFDGMWVKGLSALEGVLQKNAQLSALRRSVDSALGGNPESLALWAMIQLDWQKQDKIDDTVASYVAAAQDQIGRTASLMDDLRGKHGDLFGPEVQQSLDALKAEAESSAQALSDVRTRWLRVRKLKRRIALANPLLDFGPMLVCKRVPPSWSHLVAQYFGWRQRPGGGLYVVDRPGTSLQTRDILRGQLPPGSVLEPRLSYDGQRILFAFVACSNEVPEPASLPVNQDGSAERYFHLYEINVDGTGLRQLTDGLYDDMMADYLPDGDIVFCSTRRQGYARCFGPEYSYRWHTYTLHRMDADGGQIRTLSYNDVSEWFPAVSNSGYVLHARWDYIDRDAVTHQNLWAMRPDGTNPIAVWGNATPKPHCTFQAKSIPNSNKIVFIAAAHHAITAGPVCVLDPAVDVTSLDAVTRITPMPFPEAEGKLDEWYAAPWPLSEDGFLVAYSPYRLRFQGEHMRNPNPDNALGVCLLDAAGNRELLYRDPDIGTTNPTPLTARSRPPILTAAQPIAGRNENTGTMLVTDVYQGLGDVPRGTIKELRIVQIFPKATWLANQPRMGVAGEENGRAILGTVPVESDGSAYFELPAATPILFQALDERGMAYQTMRSLTFVQPGERVSCIGCHEHRASSPLSDAALPLALRRPPSTIRPNEWDGRPFGFVEVVQPVLNKHCVRCHGGEKTDANLDLTAVPHEKGLTRSYVSLCGTPDKWKSRDFDPALAEAHFVPRFVQRNQIQVTPPGGAYGARGSRLMKLLLAGHEDVKLTSDEIRRLAAWIDMNAIFYSVSDPDGMARQMRGERVAMPDIQ